MGREEAQRLLTEVYREVDEGKALRRTNKALRRQGIDPPMDVQYTAEPVVADVEGGLGVFLQADILIYNEFPELEQCVATFEDELWRLVERRLEKALRRWVRRQRAEERAARPG